MNGPYKIQRLCGTLWVDVVGNISHERVAIESFQGSRNLVCHNGMSMRLIDKNGSIIMLAN